MLSCVLIATAVVAFIFRRGVRSSPAAYFAAFCLFFLFGPIFSYYLGQKIYQGTNLANISVVANWYLTALLGLLAADLTIGNASPRQENLRTYDRDWRLVKTTLILLGTYGWFFALTVGAGAGTKRAGLAAAGGFHYRYLLLEAILVSSFWFFREHPKIFNLYIYNLGGYLTYCLAFQERDFVFVMFAVVASGVAFGHVKVRWAFTTGLMCLYVATELFLSRMNREFSVSGLLNQGSNLFVDTFLASLHRTTLEPITHTYSNLLLARPPTELGSTGDWLKSVYAPDSSSGYGFSLVGEARYNMGTLGIAVVFFALGCLLILSFRGNYIWDPRIVGPSLLFAFMYGLRGDMRAVLVGLLFVAVVNILLKGFIRVQGADSGSATIRRTSGH